MTSISDDDLRFFDSQGLIPGPDENEETFLKRAQFCLNLKNTLNAELGGEIPFQTEEGSDLAFFSEAKLETKERFGITPDWIPIFFSNYQLYPWHGGCAWIFQLKKESPVAALLQLRKKLHNSKKLLGFYDRDELITHELSHVGRMAFEEPQFEEVIAYTTARSSFRRYFGPLLQSSVESFLFLIVLIGIIVLDASLILFYPFAYPQAMWLKIFPLAMIAFATFRLWKKQKNYKNCYKHLVEILEDSQKASHVLYRLTDREILSFAKWNRNQIEESIEKQSSLRWKAIRLCAFSAA